MVRLFVCSQPVSSPTPLRFERRMDGLLHSSERRDKPMVKIQLEKVHEKSSLTQLQTGKV